MIERQYQVRSKPFIKEKFRFNMENSSITNDSFKNIKNLEKNDSNSFSTMDEVLNNLQLEMMEIFNKQFISFKQICKSKKINEEQSQQHSQEESDQIQSQKHQEQNDQGERKKTKSIWNIQQLQSLNSHKDCHNSQQSFVLSQTSHEIRKFKTKQSEIVQPQEIQRLNSQDFFLSPQSKKFMRSNGYIKQPNNVSQNEIQVERDKNAVSIRLIDNFQSQSIDQCQSQQFLQSKTPNNSNQNFYDEMMFLKRN